MASTVAEGYAFGESIAETADFSVVRAWLAGDDAPVLLKVMRASGSTSADLARFKHQYDRIAHLASPGLIGVRGVQALATGLCVVLEDYPGSTFERLLASSPSRKLKIGEVLDIAAELAEGLAAMHAAGLIHGDLRPQNLLVGARGEIEIMGFGVDAEITRAHERLYAPEVVTDVLPYVSPEQTGRMNRSVDYRTDLYSLGVILYETLTGRRPFEAQDPMELIHAHLALAPVPPSARRSDHPRGPLRHRAQAAREERGGPLPERRGPARRRRALPRGPARHGDDRVLRRGPARSAGPVPDPPEALRPRPGHRGADRQFRERACGPRESVLVSGYSGIGKTSLVHEILRPLARQKGYFTSGKSDQYHRDTPYSGVIQAFDGLVRQILTESEARIEHWRSAILEALGSNAQVVCEVIPSLSHVIGPQPPVPALGPLEAQNRLNRYFLLFVSVFARGAHPLVLFLDDLQWIDPASLGLLRELLAADSLEALFFCGAYRDNEVSPGHPLVRAIDDLKRAGLLVRDIVLAPLARPHLLQMLSDSLERDDCGPLADAVQKKTGGNPFFVKEFIRSLHDSSVLTFAVGSGWRWDLARIDALAYTDNVVDLMVRTITRLPPEAVEALKLAAAIGSRFELDVLATVSECSPEEAYGRLDPAMGDGLLIARRDGYHFAHDKVQEGAYAMIPEAKRPAFHLRIGRLLAGKLDLSESQNLFDVVGHLNSAGDLVSDPGEQLSLARMNFDAACRAEDAAAFDGALRYLQPGLLRLPEDAWASQYPLRLQYAMKTSLMLSLSGRHEEALALLSESLEHATSRLDRTEVLRLKMKVQVLKNDLPAALKDGLIALRLFGIDLPLFPDKAMVDAQIQVTMALVREKTLEALPDLPPLLDPEIRAMQDVLEELLPPCWFLSPNNVGITVAKSLENTLRYGFSTHATFGCINFGMFLCARGDIELGYRFGRAAVGLSERYPDKKSEPVLRVNWGCTVQHWRESYTACKESLLAGLHAGLETGQYVWAFYATHNIVTISLLRGLPLSEVLAEAHSYQPIRKLDGSNTITWIVAAIAQVAHQLSVETAHPARLKGAWIDIDEVIEQARRVDNQPSLFYAYLQVVLLGVFQGAFEEVARIALSLDLELPNVAGWLGIPAFHFYAGVALTQAADVVSPDERSRFLARAENFAEKLSRWAELCPENLAHRSALLGAELARIRGDSRAAWEGYDQAIALARRGGYLHDEALANELAGLSFHALGKATIARTYLTEAHRAYGRWGATEAMRRLERSYPDLVPSEILKGATGSEATALDLGSVLKASQAMSGEIVLDRLLDALMRILVENAGARRSVLLLVRDGQLVIEAEHRIGEAAVHMLGAAPLESRPDLPSNVIRYVARTRETVLLDDRIIDSPLGRDPGFAGTAPFSSLAAPIGYKGRLTGVVYLENDLTRSAFSSDRLELIRLLSTQAAISIDNARLYDDLKQENGERRRAETLLRDSQAFLQAIVDNSSALIYAKDHEGRFMLVNRRFEELTRMSREELVGKTDHDLFPREEADAYRAVDLRVLTEGSPIEAEEHAALEDGLHTFVSVKAPLRDPSGKPYALCGISTDITARKRAEEALRKSEDQLRQAQKMEAIGNLAGGVAHDFNNLLTVILGYTAMLAEDMSASDPGRARLDAIEEAGQRAAALTRQLLAFGRKQILAPKIVDLGKSVVKIERMLRRLIGEDIELTVHSTTPLDPVFVDPGQVDQIIMNLAVNARDAMPTGGRLTIETANVVLDETYAAEHVGVVPGPHVMLAVSDTGVGMAPTTQARMFEPFFTTKEPGKGTGLGLSTVFGIVQQSGGSIWVYSELGKGTTFKIYFPRSRRLVTPTVETSGTDGAYRAGSETILLVEDDARVRSVARTILDRAGYVVLEANTGSEALTLAEQHPATIHLLLTDVVMPAMGGPELADRLRVRHPATKVLFMSGYTDHSIVHQGVLDSGVAFLQKPLTPDNLLRRVREVLDV